MRDKSRWPTTTPGIVWWAEPTAHALELVRRASRRWTEPVPTCRSSSPAVASRAPMLEAAGADEVVARPTICAIS